MAQDSDLVSCMDPVAIHQDQEQEWWNNLVKSEREKEIDNIQTC